MAVRNVRGNQGIIAGRDVTNSSVINNGTPGGTSEEELLEELSGLLADLLKDTRLLPASDRTAARSEIVRFQEEIESPDRDRGRVGASLDRLKSVAAAAAPLAEIVRTIAEITAQIVH